MSQNKKNQFAAPIILPWSHLLMNAMTYGLLRHENLDFKG